MKRSRLVLAIILLAITVLCVSLWDGKVPLSQIVMLKSVPLGDSLPSGGRNRIYIDVNAVRGWKCVKRWQVPQVVHGPGVGYWVRTGFKRMKFECRDGTIVRMTYWKKDGIVDAQYEAGVNGSGNFGSNLTPPWWWGVEDQTEPSAPWWGKE